MINFNATNINSGNYTNNWGTIQLDLGKSKFQLIRIRDKHTQENKWKQI